MIIDLRSNDFVKIFLFLFFAHKNARVKVRTDSSFQTLRILPIQNLTIFTTNLQVQEQQSFLLKIN